MYIIGITGPTGSGKTTALRVLEDLGARVYDCDAVYHELLQTSGELLGRIEAAFPGAVKHWSVDRKALAARVFADPAALERLTAVTQPFVAERVRQDLAEAAADPRGPALAVIDAIGLFESGLASVCDRTAAVVAPEEDRVRRIMGRDRITEEQARARIAAQKSAAYFTERADLVLENNGTEAEFAAACRAAFARQVRSAGQRPNQKSRKS